MSQNIGLKIQIRRKQLEMTLEEVAEIVGVGKSTVAKWESGKIANMKRDKIAKLAEALKVDPSYLMGWKEDPKSQLKTIPLLGNIAAGQPVFADNNIVDYIKDVEKGDYALTIKGDSMEPLLYNGYIIIVDKNAVIENGDIVVVLINGEDAICKKYKKVDEGIMLVSLNSSYEPKFFSKKDVKSHPVNILGKVVELRAKL